MTVITTTVNCAALPEVAPAVRRLHRARGIDPIVFLVADRPWFHVERTANGWTTTPLA